MGGGGAQNTVDPIIGTIQLNTSAYGKAVALCYGKSRVAGNMIWYNDFTAIPHTTSQGGGGKGGGSAPTNTTYTYTAAAIMGLCEGPITGIGSIWAGKEKTDGTALGFSVYPGSSLQSPFGYVTMNHPGEALGYRRLAYVATGSYDLGSNASLPNHNFEIDGLLPFSSTIRDALPPAIVTDFLTEPFHGVGLPSNKLGDLTQWANYCTAAGLFISPSLTTQIPAAEFVDRLTKAGNAAAFFSEGVIKVVPYGDSTITGNGVTYVPNNTPAYALTDDDFISDGGDPVVVVRGNPADAFNQVQVQYNNRANQYNQDIAETKDQANIEIYGLRPMDIVDMGDICETATARALAQLILQRSLYIRNTFKFKLGWKYCLLEPMDIVTLTEGTGSGLVNQPVRITSIEENEDGTFNIEAEDYIGGVASHVTYPSQLSGGYVTNYNAPPGSVSTPVIFDAPGRMADTGYELWMAVAGTNPLWGGATVWVSTDGATYAMVGQVGSRSRYGYLQSAFGSGSDPDTSNSAAVDFTTSVATLTSGTATDADNLNTLCWCDGELFSYQTATLTATNKYTLGTRLRRGVYGTQIAAHASGKPVVRLDGNIARYAYDPAMIGKQVWVKFCSFNVYGSAAEGLAAVAPYTYIIGGPIGAPGDVTGGTSAATTSGVLLSWNPSTSPNLAQYEIRLANSNWGVKNADYVGATLSTRLPVSAIAAGSKMWYVKAIDTSGRYSVNAMSIVLTASAPSAPTVTAQVIDNNVLLFWTASLSTQIIDTYEIRRGATWAGATVVGTKSGLFTSVFETVSGVFTYWVAAIDIGGNYGTPASITTTVSQPPDYVLKADINSTLSGTLTNAIKDSGAIVLPVNTAETYAAHFTAHAWATPQDQITAGYPIFIEPALTTGSYSETIDYGATLAACKISVSMLGTVLAGTVTPSCTITVAQDAGFTTGVQAFVGAVQAYAVNFRYVKAQINVSAAGGANLYRIDSLNIKLDVKLKNDAGSVVWNGNPKTATFNVPFVDVTSIQLTPMGTTASLTAVTDFVDVANPTTFKIYLFNSTNGAVPTGPITVAWSAKGY